MAKDKKGGKAKEEVGGSEPAATADAAWECEECSQENEATESVCCACEAARPASESTSEDRFKGYVVGVVVSVEDVPKKDKLTVAQVDVGASEPLQVVTNAPNVVEGARVVVATVGASVRGESGEDEIVKKGPVGGVMSSGMLCNGSMLGWKGGDNKCAATLPDTFPVGSTPPDARPRKEA